VKNISIRQVNLNYSRLKETQPEKNITPPLANKSLLNARKVTIDNKSSLMAHEVILL
jgi:hypothetical protein